VTLGMLVRDDNGGLGNLTYEAFRHLRPDVTAVVQSRPCRGKPRPHIFEEAWTQTLLVGNPIPDQKWQEIASLADVWWTAETWYCDQAETIIGQAGKRSVLYAMPELFSGSIADEVWNPTQYLSERSRLGDVMEWPTSPHSSWTVRTKVRRILHISAGAQYDRNGTQTFLAALKLLEMPCEVMLHQPDVTQRVPPSVLADMPNHVIVKQTNDYVSSMNALYRWADMLVLPRRYAGLCLPAFEALGHGCLVMMSETDPQVWWPVLTVPAVKRRHSRMKGGQIPMVEVNPNLLAQKMDAAMEASVPDVAHQSERGRKWCEEKSWENQTNKWKERLCG